MTIRYHSMLCFGRHETSGNTALVVEGFSSDAIERQTLARQRSVAATVFIDRSSDGKVCLDFYYPHARSPLCLHATLAASAVLFEQHPDSTRLEVVTSLRGQVLQIEKHGERILVDLQVQACPPVTIDAQQAALLLGANATDLIGAPRLASVGSAKLLVEVRNESTLYGLAPDLAGIAAWSQANGVSGLYAWCTTGNDVYAGRNFNHLDPRLEDAGTGVAAGALAAMLKHDITLHQGDGLGQPCTLFASYQDGIVKVGGRAVADRG
ncbi:PhzF family phenazine biosynthesis protein [Paraburkholderia sp. J67]|uniref:PhzF family phenazine biosynthesis protein n=1 Tax=Paraburkholderia sp. J67 TaxID=2805435 RepID=UPI002ABE9A36|nr:PhzF family phenazine biosynthesis protein [Paraburkholderia sp. J67]